MTRIRESSETVKDRIIEVARELFAQHGINGISIRKIAAEAGVNHALLIRYFGSKAELVSEILHREISALTTKQPETPEQIAEALAFIRKILLDALTTHKSMMRLIIRSALDGLSPESYVKEHSDRVANLLANWIQSHQTDSQLPDPKLMSVVINAAMFSLVANAPWLMSSVGLPPEDFEKRKQDIVDVLMWIIVQAVGLPSSCVDFAQMRSEMQ